NFMIDTHVSNKYSEVIPPFIVNQQSMFATGQLPKFSQDVFKLISNVFNIYPTYVACSGQVCELPI
ncbi:MAG: hypothetical protein Q8731_02720, partial [Candidatus Phytoplasma australasiaticum]|nr:hypothetical protein [Candidatus Phytoplasma australasiaticum]